MKMTRNEFLKSMAAASVAATGIGAAASFSAACAQPDDNASLHGLTLGVSVYSFNRDFVGGTMNLEKCMADISDMGATDIEILGEAHIPNYPNPSNEWIDQWFSWLDKYNLKPSAYALFIDDLLYKGRRLSPEECVEEIMVDFKLANQLGFKVFRGGNPFYPPDDPADNYLFPYVHSTEAIKFLEAALPYCEQYDVKFAMELHSPSRIKSKWIDGILEFNERTKTPYVGFNPDWGAFTYRPASGTVERYVEQGANKEIIEYIISAYKEDLGPDKTVEEVKKMGGGEIEQRFASVNGIFHNSYNDPKDLSYIAPYVYHTHAKVREQQADLTDYMIDVPAVLQEYVNNGIKGISLSTENEDRNWPTSIGNRLQHAMMRKILANI